MPHMPPQILEYNNDLEYNNNQTMGQTEEKRSTKRRAKEEWRRYGSARRKELVARDESRGGTSFEMNKKTKIERYFRVAEKAFLDFQKKCQDPQSDTEETYVMGHRLTAFLGKALPQHPNFRKSDVTQLRHKSQRNLEWVKKQIEILALKIDEEQLNTYITNDFDPVPDDETSSSSEADDELSSFADFSSMGDFDDQQEWQDFAGWAFSGCPRNPFSEKEIPLSTETDSSQSHDACSDHGDFDEQLSDEFHVPGIPADGDDFGENEDEPTVKEPKAFVTFQDDDDDEDPGAPSEFFRKIRDEVATSTAFYESDSEAVDSWAQDGESRAHSCASSGTSFDAARVPCREILDKEQCVRVSFGATSCSQQNGRPPMIPPKSILTLTEPSEDLADVSLDDDDEPDLPLLNGADPLLA